jgi:hypothetical protein
MTRRTRLSDDELDMLFFGTWNVRRDNVTVALRLIEEAGYQAGLEARRTAPAESQTTRERHITAASRVQPVVDAFAAACEVTVDELLMSRAHSMARRRRQLVWVLHDLHGLTHAEAGLACNLSRPQATLVIHGVNKEFARNPSLRSWLMGFARRETTEERAA